MRSQALGRGDGSRRRLIRPPCIILRQRDAYRGEPDRSHLVAHVDLSARAHARIALSGGANSCSASCRRGFVTGSKHAMEQIRQKRPRLRLSVEGYNLLRHRGLERDAWWCQNYSSSKDLQVHHLAKWRKLGDDALDNLLTLCKDLPLRVPFSEYCLQRFIVNAMRFRDIAALHPFLHSL
jgi:hypothetical protein